MCRVRARARARGRAGRRGGGVRRTIIYAGLAGMQQGEVFHAGLVSRTKWLRVEIVVGP